MLPPRIPTLLFVAALVGVAFSPSTTSAVTYHVATTGNDDHPGTRSRPLRTIQRAADRAQPGDVITVHTGIYRERVRPPRGGTSDRQRIVYQAAPGETVEIRGSERIANWTKVQDHVWKVTLPNTFFGSFNPYQDLIRGDWFEPRGRPHHTGAVYLDGDWLIEATTLEEVLQPIGTRPAWLTPGSSGYLLNVAWFRPVSASTAAPRIPAAAFAARQGTQTAPCAEGGECLGFIEAGHWASYAAVDFGPGTERLELRVASASAGGVIELHLDNPTGPLLGTATVRPTGGWQSWETVTVPIRPTQGKQTLVQVFKSGRTDSAPDRSLAAALWFAQVDARETTLWAQFPDVNPNEHTVEINVRQSVFYPDQPGRNYLTVRGFALRHAATPWAPPTAQQIGLIGTHWSRGWIIENNVVSHSTCSGIALGKYGDAFDNTSANTAEGYVKTIERALANGWQRETIGHHVVRNNTVSHCEQAGIVGSLGAAFSTITGNTIHDIHVRRLFTGAEMAGIKFHAAIDTVIQGNHIYRTCLGLWLDWMAQGTRVSANLFHDNAGQDLFVEVDHGPFVVDNNLFLSPVSLLDMSEGGAYAHNLFRGRLISRPEPGRETPYHPAHTTRVAGLSTIKGGDDRYFNNVFVGPGAGPATAQGPGSKDPEWRGGYGLWVYDSRERPLQTHGNLYFHGARPYRNETSAVRDDAYDPIRESRAADGSVSMKLDLGASARRADTRRVTTADLGLAAVPQLPYENADGSPLRITTDYRGRRRSAHPVPGPFEATTSHWPLP